MFLRKKRKVAGGESYDYWSLCETVRTAKGPRQRVVAGLGKLDEEDIRSGGWEDMESLLGGKPRPRSRQLEFGEEAAPSAPRWEKVDVGAVRVERVRVMDRGMVSEANIAFLRERKALYIVGTWVNTDQNRVTHITCLIFRVSIPISTNS